MTAKLNRNPNLAVKRQRGIGAKRTKARRIQNVLGDLRGSPGDDCSKNTMHGRIGGSRDREEIPRLEL